MNGKDIHDAVEYVGYDLVDTAEKQRFARPFWQTALPVAAMIALLLGVTVTLPQPVQTPENTIPVEVPTLTEPAVTDTKQGTEETATIHPLNELFPILAEIPPDTFPEVDWNTFYLNEAGLDDDGTDFTTIHGDQVLAIDAKNGILLIRVKGEDYQGVLAVVNDPMKLSLQASSQIGVAGETIGTIAEAHNGVLAINASGFLDENGAATGGHLSSFSICDGTAYNEEWMLHEGQARLEIDSSGQFHIASPAGPLGQDVRHAVQSVPYLIIDGNISDNLDLWSGAHPRSCIGQTETGAVLLLVIEGRMLEYSLGFDLAGCANILARYGAVQAMTLDYGTSSILWYDGEYITKCSNQALPEGRPLPNAFVVERAE